MPWSHLPPQHELGRSTGRESISNMTNPLLDISLTYFGKPLLELSGGFKGGGINFDAKIRRNSTDPEDLFLAHIGGMDTFARALIAADNILSKSNYKKFRTERYASFDSGKGKEFEQGKLTLDDLRAYAIAEGEPQTKSGKQEWLENLVNKYV